MWLWKLCADQESHGSARLITLKARTKACTLVVEFSARMQHTGAYLFPEGSSSQALTKA